MSIRIAISVLALAILPLPSLTSAQAEDSADKAKAVKDEGGKYLDADGNPTYKIENGTVDWYTFSGYRRYHSDCHVCHGPDGVGSSYAPALATSLKNMDYATFLSIVAEGRKSVGGGKENVMPAFGENKNIYCYMDDLYVYLRARSTEALGRQRPAKKEDKTEAYTKAEDACMGNK